MHTNKTFAVIVIVALLMSSACAPKSTPTLIVPVTGPLPEAIGMISAENTLVESGPSDNLIPVTQIQNFFNNDTVRVTNGGIAKLDFFVNQISIRLFNDTAVDDVKADPSGTPDRFVRMKLVFGGLSGEVTKNGIPVHFELTNGVNIYILGTQFLVLFDPETSTTYIGNFEGTVAYSIPGQLVQFTQAGQLYEISSNFEIKQSTLNFTRTDIENLTSSSGSSLLATLKDYLAPTATPIPTATPTLPPTITSTPTRTRPCDKAAFVTDVTVPDGTSFSPGFQFTKIWRLQNVGTCTWTSSYSLVFYKGEQMGGPASVNIPSTVAPGQTVDIAVGLVAPALAGSYRGDWMLRSSSGVLFGAGANGTTPIWVNVNVMGVPDLTMMITSGPTISCGPNIVACFRIISVGFVITNTSQVDLTNSFEVLIETTLTQSKTITVNGLTSGASQNFSETLAVPAGVSCFSPNCTARVTVDSSNIVLESNEGNNVLVSVIQQTSITQRVADINPGPNGSNPAYLTPFSNALYFSAESGDGAGAELWKYDGGLQAASRAADISAGVTGSNPGYLTVYNGALYFRANGNDGAGTELWRFNGSAAGRLTDINSGAGDANLAYMTVFNNILYFSANGNDGTGIELWKTDGTTASRTIDIYSGAGDSNPTHLAVYNNALYFSATSNDGTGTELWKYDGTNASRISDINSGVGNSNPAFLTVFNNILYFSASSSDGTGNELWKYDGTTVSRAADINSGAGDSTPSFLTVFNNGLFFSANGNDGKGNEIWKYDGSTATRVSDINVNGDSNPSNLAVYNNQLYFQADGGDGAGKELWVLTP